MSRTVIKHDDLDVSWLGYAAVRIELSDGFVVYFDPGRYDVLDDCYVRDGGLILATHNRHYDSDAIEQVTNADATVVVFEGIDVATIDRDVVPVEDLPYGTVRVDKEVHLIVGEIDVWSLPVLNDPDSPHLHGGDVVHPQGFGYGSHVPIVDRTVSWPDDSSVFESHKHLEVPLFLANIGGSVAMDHREAVDLAETLDPNLVLPTHYDTIPFLETDPDAFIMGVVNRGIPVVLDNPDQV